MLTNLRTIARPTSLEEAARLLIQPGVYPLYGGGASLIREGGDDIQAAVDLTKLVPDQCGFHAKECWIGGGATLQTIASADAQMAGVIGSDTPLTLRNVLTLGDILIECHTDSLVLAMLLGLEAQIRTYGSDPIEIAQWFNMTHEQRCQCIIEHVVFRYYPVSPIRFLVEKVSRTPGDAPIVAAVGFAHGGYRSSTKVTFFAVICGIADRPVRFEPVNLPKLHSQRSDYKGSAEYRTAAARIVGQRAILQAVKRAAEGPGES